VGFPVPNIWLRTERGGAADTAADTGVAVAVAAIAVAAPEAAAAVDTAVVDVTDAGEE
jgi:hypothetical protein